MERVTSSLLETSQWESSTQMRSLRTTLRLRTQLLIATVVVIAALSGASLLILRHTVRSEIDRETRDGLAASVRAFEAVQSERQAQLLRTAAMLAEMPPLKAMLTTEHGPTIQDASQAFWDLAGSDLFLLAKTDGTVLGLHVKAPDWSAATAEQHLKESQRRGMDGAWWYQGGRLYWVVTTPVTAGSGADQTTLGLVTVGYQVDNTVARELARFSASQIVLATGGHVIASTLSAPDEPALSDWIAKNRDLSESDTTQLNLGSGDYEVASVLLHRGLPAPVRCYVLLPLAKSNQFLQKLNRSVFALGFAAVILAAALFSWISRAVTKPLENLVAGVRAFAAGDPEYAITPRGSVEVAELSTAFSIMRTRMIESQRLQIESERVAALGRAAGSISHDLRHYLATLVANAEFLYESESLKLNRDEVYQEIKTASEQMTDLIDSLRELSRDHGTISPVQAHLDKVVRRAVESVRATPEFRSRTVSVKTSGDTEGVFDPKRLERVFLNLIVNACEAAPPQGGCVSVKIRGEAEWLEVEVTDNGKGIPSAIRETLFDPFVSLGKVNGTGLGLAIVSKILSEHNGSVRIGSTSAEGTTMVVSLPRSCRKAGAQVVSSLV